jgi:adenylosuccinate lyase
LDRAALDALLSEPLSFTGLATQQVVAVVTEIGKVAAAHPVAARYTPGTIL